MIPSDKYLFNLINMTNNLFQLNVPFVYPLKTSENPGGIEMQHWAIKWVKQRLIDEFEQLLPY